MATYDQYRQSLEKIADLKNALAVLQWDQEVYLPSKGASFRGRQMATLSEQIHGLSTEEKFGDQLKDLLAQEGLSPNEKKNISLSWEDYSKQKKYSSAFVRIMSETISACFHSWMEARKKNSFSAFEQNLEKLVGLKKEEAEILGYDSHPYNALLNEYEKGCTVSHLDAIFAVLLPQLKALLEAIRQKKQVDDSFLHKYYSRQEQWNFGLDLIRQLGFDFEAGRQDISEHPFTTSFNVHDVRITTRVDEHNFGSMTWSCIHEAGHALYEQGLPESEYGLPSGEFASLGVHESQSRLWENNIGRSLEFWTFQYPALQTRFPEALGSQSLEAFYKGINKVQPSLIRTEADELTYHFHIMIRYELEKELIAGNLKPKDIPAYWNEQYMNYLGVGVKDDRSGCLQDVHWSHGSFGYFPTYSLGSFYAAQLFEAISRDNPDLKNSILIGDTRSILDWLRQRVYKYGRLLTSEEICIRATGEPLKIQYFMNYLLAKYNKIYDI